MTIAVDGERSRRRLPAAEQALRSIVGMGLPAKGGNLDGFSFKVWQMDGGNLIGGRIVAPFGICVTLSDENGIRQFTCDSAQSAAAPTFSAVDNDRYIAVLAPLSTSSGDSAHVFVGGTVGGMSVKTAPAVLIEAQQWKASQPIGVPVGGEYIVTFYTYQRNSGNMLVGAQATHCYGNGFGDVVSPSIDESWSYLPYDQTNETVNNHYGMFPLLTTAGYFEYVKWKQGVPFYDSAGKPIMFAYEYYYAPAGTAYGRNITADMLYPGASADWLAKLSSMSPTGLRVRQMAAYYSRIVGDVIGVSLLWPNSQFGCAVDKYSDPTSSCVSPTDQRWNLSLAFYSITNGCQAVDWNVLSPALQALADAELAWDVAAFYPSGAWTPDVAKLVAGALFGWPVRSAYTGGARDTSTFSDANGAVYSWLRCTDPNAIQDAYAAGYNGARHGGFKFTYPDGFIRVPLAMPSTVLADVTLRPRIMLMTATTYCCIADTADGEIHGLYLGSPFGAWQDVGLPTGVTMYAIRVVQPGDTLATAGFIGIGKETTPNGPVYRVYIKLAGFGWSALSPIPVSSVTDLAASWDVCVFGDDPLVHAMQSARQHPAAIQNIPPALR